MNDLVELIQVVSKTKVKQIEVIGNDAPYLDSKYQKLYDLVHSNPAISEQEVCQELYGNRNISAEPYKKVKQRLKSRLLNTLFFIDINQAQFTDIDQAFITCNRNWMAINTLLNYQARVNAIQLAEQTLRVALKFEFTELTVYLCKTLIFHYSLVESNTRKYSEYHSKLGEALHSLNAEVAAEQFYTEIMQQFSRKQQKIQLDALTQAQKYCNTLQKKYENVESYRFIRISYLLYVVTYQTAQDFDKAIEKCIEAKKIISQKPFKAKKAIFAFDLRLLSCYIQLKRFAEGAEIANYYTKSLKSGSQDWFVTLFYHFLLYTHSGLFNNALEILDSAFESPKFKSLYPNFRQLWNVNQAYIAFLAKIGKIKDSHQHETSKALKFRLYKFLNDIPIYSKDKRGINISILIIHVLFLLSERKHSEIIDRVDALNQYCHRYLKRDDTFRANCFIKMLLQMPRADFNRIRTTRYAGKYHEQLLSMPLNVAVQGIEVEIIPYEILWDITLDLLD